MSVILYLFLSTCLLATVAQPPGNTQVTCLITAADSFCLTCDTATKKICSDCPSNYLMHDTTGLCTRIRIGDASPSNMVNNVRTYVYNVSSTTTVQVVQTLDPYCVLPTNINATDAAYCASCTAYPDKSISTTNTTQGGAGGGQNTVTTYDFPRYLGVDLLSCHSHCKYASTGMYTNTNVTQGLYQCAQCSANCIKCSSGTNCQECIFSKKRFQGAATIDNFLNLASGGALSCNTDKTDTTKTLIYYVAPADSAKRCTGSCSNDGTGALWDDLTLVFKDIITQAASYTSIDVKIYLLKSGTNLVHYVLDIDNQAGFYGYNYYTPNTQGHLPRPFERTLATVYIGPIYCSDKPAQQGCLSAGEKPTLKWKSSMTHLSVTKTFTIENVIIDGSDMTSANVANAATTNVCMTQRKECCKYDSTTGTVTQAQSPSSCTPSSPDYADWSTNSTTYESTYKAEQIYGVFVFEFIRDKTNAPVPTLTMSNCEVRNFFYSKYHTSFIQMNNLGGNLVIEDTIFDRFFFPHGLISNSQISLDRNLFGFSSFSDETCRSLQGLSSSVNCHNVTIVDSNFTNYNPYKTTNLQTNDVHSIEGAVLAVHNLDGPITIYNCVFQGMLAFNRLNSNSSGQHNCVDFEAGSWGAETSTNQSRHNIGPSSYYKIFLDKHFRKYAENKLVNTSITAAVHIRNVTKGLTIYKNTFDKIYTVAGGAIYIEGFNNTQSAPIIISSNIFTNNFAQFIGANLFIYKYGYNIPRLECSGILVDTNTFTDNYGCLNTIGNVILACEPNDYNGYSYPSTTGSDSFASYYTTYSKTSNQAFAVDDYSYRNFTRFLKAFSSTKTTANTYTHSVYTALTFDSKKVIFSNNVLERNYMKLSNGFYIQGPLSLLVQGNTFKDNSIPMTTTYSNTAFSSNAFKLASSSVPAALSSSYMVESVPLIIRQANYITVKQNTFDSNSQGFMGGDYYLAQAITMFQMIGQDEVSVKNNTFKNHAGLTVSDSTNGYFKYASSPLVAFNFWEMTSEYVKGLDEDNDGTIDYPDPNSFTVEDCVFENNTFDFNPASDTKGLYYENSALKKTYLYPFSHILKYFNGEEASGNSQTQSFTSPVSWSSGGPMISLHVTVNSSNITSNTFNNGFCAFTSFWFNQFDMDTIIFKDNALLDLDTNAGGYICAIKDQLFKQFNNGSTLTFSDISFTNDNGTLFYLTSIEKADPDSTQPYIINIDTVTLTGTTSDVLAPFAAISASKVGVESVTASSFFGTYGLFYLSSVTTFYANTIDVTDSVGDNTGLIYADTAQTTEFHNLVCSNNTFSDTTGSTFDWTQVAINQNITAVKALFKQADGNLTLVDSTISGSSVPLGFISSDGNLNLQTVTISDMVVVNTLFLAIGSTTVYFNASNVYDLTATDSTASAGVIISDSSKVTAVSSNFYSITAPTSGFLLCKLSTITLTSSNISYITTTGQNAVLSAKLGKVSVTGTYIGYNVAEDQNIFSVTLGALTIDSSTFEKNQAASMSSGVFVKKSIGTAKITSTNFTGRNELDSEGSVLAEFLVVYDSSVSLDAVTFYNAYASAGAMYVDAESYTITLNNITATDNYAEDYGVVTVWGKLVITSSTFTGNKYSIYTEATDIDIEDTTFSEEIIRSVSIVCTDSDSSIILFDNVTFNGYPDHSLWSVTDSFTSVNDSAAIYLSGCSGVTIKNSQFNNLIDVATKECGAGIYMYSESSSSAKYTLQISNTDFYNTIATNGGAICIANNGNGMSKVDMTDVLINSARAVELGAGIYYDNFATTEKTVTYTSADGIDYLNLSSDVVIQNSIAGTGGGGIYYTQLRPTSTGLTFSSNSASYGPNWGSYPVEITVITDPDSSIYNPSRILKENNGQSYNQSMQSRSLMTSTSIVQDFVSGQQLDPPVVLGLLDVDGQIVGNWDSSSVTVTYTDSSLKASTTTEFTAENGYFVLKPLILSYVPGKSVDITLTTSIETLSSDILGIDESISLKITPLFRYCTVGERLTDANECEECAETKALFEENSKDQCTDCPDNMNCYGGSKIGPVANYARFSNWNNRAVACLNDEACLGDYLADTTLTSTLYCKEVSSSNSSYCHTTWCSARYTGNLCATCTAGNAKSSDIYCVACSNNPGYYVLAVFVIIGAIGFIVFTVRNALKVKDFTKTGGKPKTSILIKIFLNYVQLVSIVASFDFQWPDQVKSLFTVNSKVSSSTSEVFSVDCFLPSSSNPNVKPFFVKLLFISLSPIVLVGVSALVWYIIMGRRKPFDKNTFKSNLTTTCVVLLFMIHTTLVQTSILGFRCQNIGDASGDRTQYYLERDLEVECWEGLHLMWVFAVAMPAFVLWGIGIPLFAYRILKKNQKAFENAEFKTKYGFLYDGYKLEKYYWEFIILYRKVIMIFISVFMVTYGTQIQALAVLGVSFLSYILHMKGKPFQEDDLNSMEKKALINATITLYCGIYYITGELPTAVSYVLLVVIIVLNGIFFLSWFLTLVKEYKKQFSKKTVDDDAPPGKRGFPHNILDRFLKKNKKQLAVEKHDHENLEVQTFVGEPMNMGSDFVPRPSVMGVRPDKEDDIKEEDLVKEIDIIKEEDLIKDI